MRSSKILTILFGHIGDSLLVLALFDDMLALNPETSFLILTRRNTALITDLAAAYPAITVQQIPSGLNIIPFFITLLKSRWTFLALGLGTASEYSLPVKLFIFTLSLIPGNHSYGLDGKPGEKKRWQPLNTVVQSDYKATMLDNFRSLVGLPKNKPANVKLNIKIPANFPYQKNKYIVAHLFGISRYRSFPLRRWKSIFAEITKLYPDLPIIFTGSKADGAMIGEITATLPKTTLTYINSPLLEVGGIIDSAAFYIGVDTGITHLAGVLKQKSIIVRHIGDMRWIPTYNPNARILVNTEKCKCLSGEACSVIEDGVSYTHCMYDISDKIILDSVKLALSSSEKNIPSFAGLIDEYKS